MLGGCGKAIGEDSEGVSDPHSTFTSETTQTEKEDTSQTDKEVKNFEQKKITASKTKYVKFSKTIEAEDCKFSGKVKVNKARKGYSGKGYVTIPTTDNDWSASATLPASQYYNIKIVACADELTTSSIMVNDSDISEFTVGSEKKVKANSEKFVEISFNNIYIKKGELKIHVFPNNSQNSASSGSAIDIDKVTITASDEISKLDLTLKNPSLTNKNADYNTQALYNYLCENYGKKVILGQHDSVGNTAETELIHNTTGKYPAIRYGDMTMFTDKNYTADNEIPSALSWAKDGGIVAYMWHWTAPGEDSCYAEETKFDLSKAVTKKDISQLTIEEIELLQKSGKISKECLELVKDIDAVSKQLALLRDEGIPVIWRPLHEASNGYFWWGKDADSYKWLWKLMYNRQTKYHKLNNLIWIWSAQNANWYVGDDSCDILSVDVYDNGNKSGQINSLLFLRSICANKPIAMSECGSFPSIQNIANEKAMWSFIGQWGGNFLMNEDGSLAEDSNTADELAEMYNNNLVITREDLPDLAKLAAALEQKAKKK